MPPRSYMIAAFVLGSFVGTSFFLNLGFSMTVWAWIFSIAACILGVAGAFSVAAGLGAPRWIGIALASPGLVWAIGNLHEWIQPTPASSISYYHIAAYLAAVAASTAALKLMEMMSRSHAAFRIGYALLAVTALWVCFVQIALAMHWTFAFGFSSSFGMTSRVVTGAGSLVEYGAFIAAAILITIHHDVERWTCVPISLVSAFLLYKRVYILILLRALEQGHGFILWLQPVAIFVCAAAVWRMGVILRGRAFLKPSEHPSPA